MIKEILCSTAGAVSFAVIMNVPKKYLAYAAAGAVITSTVESLLKNYYGELTACLLSMICLTFFCELIARVKKIPATVILMPSTIPLLPGSSIYYTMFYAVNYNKEKLLRYAASTVYAGFGIALGAIISSAVIKIIIYVGKIRK